MENTTHHKSHKNSKHSKSRKSRKSRKHHKSRKSRKSPQQHKSRKSRKSPLQHKSRKSRKHHKNRNRNKKRNYMMDGDDDDKCIICMGDLRSLRGDRLTFPHANQSGCNYRVHQGCLDRFMDQNTINEDLRCPGCRDPIIHYTVPSHLLVRFRGEDMRTMDQRERDEQLDEQQAAADAATYAVDASDVEPGVFEVLPDITIGPQTLSAMRDEILMYNTTREWADIIADINRLDENSQRNLLNLLKNIYIYLLNHPETLPQYEDMVETLSFNRLTRYLNEVGRYIINTHNSEHPN